MVERNPYKQEKELDKDLVNKIANLLFARPDGVMFKLFDLGNLAFSQEKNFVYRNQIGSIMRKFSKQLQEGNDFSLLMRDLERELWKVFRIACIDGVQFEACFVEAKKIIGILVSEWKASGAEFTEER